MYSLAVRQAGPRPFRYVRLGRLGDIVSDLAGAIQRFEGWAPGSVSYRNNNPGNLRSGPGMIGTDSGGYAIFPDYATGYAALQNQIQNNIDRGLSLNQFFAGAPGIYPGYAPAADANKPIQYASTVAGWVGINPTVPLYQYQQADTAAAGAGDALMSPPALSLDLAVPGVSSSLPDLSSLPGWALAAGVIAGGALLLMVLQ